MSQPLEDVAYLLSETDPGRLPPGAAEAAFVGRSNVGKSTLLNAVCRRDVARVSNLPSYGFAVGAEAERAGWGPMVESYLKGRPSLRMIFILIDAKVGPTRLDLQMVEWLEAAGLRWRPVATKADQVKSSRAQARHREVAHALGLQPEDLAWVSAQNGLGMSELRAEVSAVLLA